MMSTNHDEQKYWAKAEHIRNCILKDFPHLKVIMKPQAHKQPPADKKIPSTSSGAKKGIGQISKIGCFEIIFLGPLNWKKVFEHDKLVNSLLNN